jgi:hypothetical protein
MSKDEGFKIYNLKFKIRLERLYCYRLILRAKEEMFNAQCSILNVQVGSVRRCSGFAKT